MKSSRIRSASFFTVMLFSITALNAFDPVETILDNLSVIWTVGNEAYSQVKEAYGYHYTSDQFIDRMEREGLTVKLSDLNCDEFNRLARRIGVNPDDVYCFKTRKDESPAAISTTRRNRHILILNPKTLGEENQLHPNQYPRITSQEFLYILGHELGHISNLKKCRIRQGIAVIGSASGLHIIHKLFNMCAGYQRIPTWLNRLVRHLPKLNGNSKWIGAASEALRISVGIIPLCLSGYISRREERRADTVSSEIVGGQHGATWLRKWKRSEEARSWLPVCVHRALSWLIQPLHTHPLPTKRIKYSEAIRPEIPFDMTNSMSPADVLPRIRVNLV